MRRQSELIISLIAQGEQLAVELVRLGETRQRDTLLSRKQHLDQRVEELNRKLEQLEKTHATAGRIIEGLREASLKATLLQVKGVEPIFQRIYSRIDPHPTFRLAQLVARMERGRGSINTTVSDPNHGIKGQDPSPIMSSSQLNALAVSLFLSLNLGIKSL